VEEVKGMPTQIKKAWASHVLIFPNDGPP
jgi:hypothetical protein